MLTVFVPNDHTKILMVTFQHLTLYMKVVRFHKRLEGCKKNRGECSIDFFGSFVSGTYDILSFKEREGGTAIKREGAQEKKKQNY